MAKKGNNMMEEEDLELDDRVMQELLHDDDSSLRNEDDDGPSGSSGSDEEESNDGDKPHYIYNYTPSKQQLLQQKTLKTQQIRDVETINEAASQLFHVIKKYGGDTSSSISSGWDEILTAKNSPWKDNVDAALDEIVAARSGMIEAWDNFHSDNVDRDSQQTRNDDDDDDDGEQPKMEWWEPILRSKQRSSRDDANNNRFNQANDDDTNNVDEQQFHHVYMEYATNAFATELEALRKGKLEQMCTTSKKKKGVNTNSGKETSSQAMELDLDPTHHSFVVASSKRSGNNDDGDDEAKAAAEIDVQVLSDMLSSGSNSLSILERNMLLKARQRGSSGAVVTSSEGLSLHERRRQELGLISGR
ncbi:hypothetical protein QTG54_007801 [Skeletonema marinoi]|uniref:Uncharacterized protein n=1 Tax=Skeletonema marinoi TaxID=267567 RepID=A0AAD8Y814_9STRA|nr:hypothetical protein QTG54_007801 [Skeletonema marinoi]